MTEGEYTRECLAIRVERKLKSRDVLDVLGELFVIHGPPEHIRSDNGSEFIAKALRQWLQQLQIKTLKEAQILIESWRYYYNTQRLHSSLGYRLPAPETILPKSHMLPYYGEAA